MADYETMQNKLKGILSEILGEEPAQPVPSASRDQDSVVDDILNKLTAGASKPAAAAGASDPIIGKPAEGILKVPEDQRILTTDMNLLMSFEIH